MNIREVLGILKYIKPTTAKTGGGGGKIKKYTGQFLKLRKKTNFTVKIAFEHYVFNITVVGAGPSFSGDFSTN